MKMKLDGFRSYSWRLACLIGAYAVLYQIMARTGMIERVMTFNFQWWEVFLIGLFLVLRFTIYLLVVPGLLALAVYHGSRRLLDTNRRSTFPR